MDSHDVVITPDVNVTTGKVNFRRHPAAAANEPSASKLANAFTQASVVSRPTATSTRLRAKPLPFSDPDRALTDFDVDPTIFPTFTAVYL